MPRVDRPRDAPDKEVLDPGQIMHRKQREAIVSVAGNSGSTPRAGGSKSIQYKQLVAEALQMTSGSKKSVASMKQAEEKLRAAITLCPERRDAHGILAQMVVLWDGLGAAYHYSRAELLSTTRDELWAKAAVAVFEHFYLQPLYLQETSEAPKVATPSWCHDEGLKTAATDAMGLLPEFEWRAVRMHALVMSGTELTIHAVDEHAPVDMLSADRERTPAELCAAAASFQKLVKLIGLARAGRFPVPLGAEDTVLLQVGDETLKGFINMALRCRRLASMLEEHDPQQRGLYRALYAECRHRVLSEVEQGGQPRLQTTTPTEAQSEPNAEGPEPGPEVSRAGSKSSPAVATPAADLPDEPVTPFAADADNLVKASARAEDSGASGLPMPRWDWRWTFLAAVLAAAAWVSLWLLRDDRQGHAVASSAAAASEAEGAAGVVIDAWLPRE